jgi:hypothetical protein
VKTSEHSKNGAILKSPIFRKIENEKKMRFKFCKQGITLILITSFIIISGCASIVSKSSYPVSINSTPSGANITVKDKKGRDVYSGNTPANFKLPAGAGFFSKASYTVTFGMDGYDTRTVPIDFKLDGWYIGNIIFGGLIGFLIVDPATGAMWKLDTEFVNETLSKTSASIDEPSLKVFGYNDIPDSWRDKLVKIN